MVDHRSAVEDELTGGRRRRALEDRIREAERGALIDVYRPRSVRADGEVADGGRRGEDAERPDDRRRARAAEGDRTLDDHLLVEVRGGERDGRSGGREADRLAQATIG